MEASGGSGGQVGITNQTFSATRTTGYAGIAGGVTAIGAAVVGLLAGVPKETAPAVVVAVFALIGIALLAYAIVAAADIRARASVDVASLEASATEVAPTRAAGSSVSPDSPLPEEGQSSRHGLMVATGARMGVLIGGEAYAVLAIRVDPVTEDTKYLVGRANALPRWRAHAELDQAIFAFDAQGFPVSE